MGSQSSAPAPKAGRIKRDNKNRTPDFLMISLHNITVSACGP
jgi:hypothetical protein